MEDKNKELLFKKVKMFLNNKKMVHVVLNSSKKFYNGVVKEMCSDFFTLTDRKAGEVVIYFEEVDRIENYQSI